MKQYIISILGVTVLCTLTQLITPSNRQKYIKIITGMIILSTIASPILKIKNINLFSDFSLEQSEINENLQTELVAKELKKQVEDDIEKRILDEFSKKSEAEVKVGISDTGEITGISEIKIKTDAPSQKIVEKMCEIYGTKKHEVTIYGYQKTK